MSTIPYVCLLLFSLLPNFESKNGSPIPWGTIWVAENYYLSKEYVTNESWENYLRLRGNQAAFYPDTSILFKGQKYFHNPKFKTYPVVGLSRSQIEEFCSWLNLSSNNLKSKHKHHCSPKYWERIAKFDPTDSLEFNVFLPDIDYIHHYKSKFDDLNLNTCLIDTIVCTSNKGKANFNKPKGLSFRFAIKYVAR
jgi:hypothetical protein